MPPLAVPPRTCCNVLLAALPALLLLAQVGFSASGIVYTLDDPYIHLTLARRILQGEYGINPGEFAAPSSSILWPFLLAPLSLTPVGEFLPLALNLAALAVTLWWIVRWFETFTSPPRAMLATVLVAFCFNLYGLPLSGMEHSLQVMLVVVVALSLVREQIAWPFWVSLILLPFIRYEGLAISLPTILYLALATRHRVAAVVAGATIVAGVCGFSAFLYLNGVGFLPASVMQRDAISLSDPLLDVGRIVNNAESLAFFLAIAGFAAVLYSRQRRSLAALVLLAAPTAAHLVLGLYGDASRYQIYFQIWVAILFLAAYAPTPLARRMPLNLLLAAGLVAGTTDSMLVTLTTPLASRNISDQQGQMAVIASVYLDEPVAILDLGLVSLRSRRYILDLAGLASFDALSHREDPARTAWIPELMKRHHVEHAIVDSSEEGSRPAAWIHVADLNLPLPCITPGSTDHVSFYSMTPEAAARLRSALIEYRKSSRDRATMLVLAEAGSKGGTTPALQEGACNRYLFPLNVNLLARAISSTRSKIGQALGH